MTIVHENASAATAAARRVIAPRAGRLRRRSRRSQLQ
jgi:hypothetical protein